MLLRGTGAYTEMPDLFSRVDSSGAVQTGCLNKLHADAATACEALNHIQHVPDIHQGKIYVWMSSPYQAQCNPI